MVERQLLRSRSPGIDAIRDLPAFVRLLELMVEAGATSVWASARRVDDRALSISGIDRQGNHHQGVSATEPGGEILPASRDARPLLQRIRNRGVGGNTHGRTDLAARPSRYASEPTIEVDSKPHIVTVGVVQVACTGNRWTIRNHDALGIHLAGNVHHRTHHANVFRTHIICVRISASRGNQNRRKKDG